MPLCIPRQVSSSDWVTVKQDAHFVIQRQVAKIANSSSSSRLRKVPNSTGVSLPDINIKFTGVFRILMRCNGLCVGEFTDKNDLMNQWRFLHPADSYLAFDSTGHDSMHKLWQDKMTSLQTNSETQNEQDFREQSAYLASVLSIMEIAKGINPNSIHAPIEDTASMVCLLTSLSRQLLITSSEMVDKLKASKLAQDLREAEIRGGRLQDAISEINSIQIEDPIDGPDSLSSSQMKSKNLYSEIPNLKGLEALVYHVDRLFELCSKQESRIHAVVKHVVSRKSNRVFMRSEILTNGTYFLPHVDRECKLADKKVFVEVATELEKSLTPQSELYDRLLSHLNERVCSALEKPNPIGKEVLTAIQHGKQFISDNLPKITAPRPPNSPHAVVDDFADMGQQEYLDMLKADVEQYVNLVNVGLQLAFDSSTSHISDRVAELTKTAVKEIIFSQLYPQLIALFRKLNDKKDDKLYHHCLEVQKTITANSLGLNADFWDIVTRPGALNAVYPLYDHFINADSVRLKYEYLDKITQCVYDIGSTGLKRIAAAAGKPFDPNKPGDNLRFAVGADDFVPLFAYVLLQANVPDLYAQFAFLSVFTDETALIGKLGYLLASLQTGIMVIAGLEPNPSDGLSDNSLEAPFTFIEDSTTPSPPRPDFVRTGTSTTNLAGTDPLSSITQTPDSDSSDDESESTDDVPSPSSSSSLSGKLSKAISKRFRKRSGSTDSAGKKSISSPNSSKSGSIQNKRDSHENSPIVSPRVLWILNDSGSSVSDAEALTGENAYNAGLKLFSLMLCLYQRYEKKLAQNGPVPPIKSDEIYKNYKDEVVQLRRVNVASMNEKQKLVFFLNVFHALQMHTFVEKDMPESLVDRLTLSAAAAYNIGGKIVTLHEIEHGILLNDAHFPDSLIEGGLQISPKCKQADWDKASYAIKKMDPRYIFVISHLAASGPPLRVYTTETIEQMLTYSTQQYLLKNVLVNVDNAVVILPKQFVWYAKDFGKKEKQIIAWVSKYLEISQKEALTSLKKNFRVKYNEFDWTFTFHFEVAPDMES